ncbi:MAG: transcription antitermination factor NusB [bacterium]|nr:transcription antitermination factor NusB [bacterium]
MGRSELRYKAMIILYQIFLYQKNNMNYNIDDVINEQLDNDNEFVRSLVIGVLDNQQKIDALSNKYLADWPIDRLGLTDQAIIRIAIYEMLYTDTPDKVAINEAIELSKKYSDDKVANIINSVLDKIYHNGVM